MQRQRLLLTHQHSTSRASPPQHYSGLSNSKVLTNKTFIGEILGHLLRYPNSRVP